MRLVREIFAPVRIKNLEHLGGAVEAWEGHVQDFELSGQRLGAVLKTFGLMQLIPDSMEEDLLKLRQQLTHFSKVKCWIMDQVAVRTKVKRAELNGVENQKSPEETVEPSQDELLAFWKTKGAGKGKEDPKGGRGRPTFSRKRSACGRL